MNKNLRTICAALALTLLPVGTVCYAKTMDDVTYETLWVEADSKVNESSNEKNSQQEYSVEDILHFRGDKEKYDAHMEKEVTVKIKVSKIKISDEQCYIMSKDSAMKKAKCMTTKEEADKCKEGDEVIVAGTLKEIKGNKILLENTKVMKVIDVTNKEYNKDKYKEKQNKEDKSEEKQEKNEKKDKSHKHKHENKECE